MNDCKRQLVRFVTLLVMTTTCLRASAAELTSVDAALVVAVSPAFELSSFFDDAKLFERSGPAVILLESDDADADRRYLCVFDSGELKVMRFSRLETGAFLRSTFRMAETNEQRISRSKATDLIFVVRSMALTKEFKLEAMPENIGGSMTVSWSVLPARVYPVVKDEPYTSLMAEIAAMVSRGDEASALEHVISRFVEVRLRIGAAEPEKRVDALPLR